MVKLESQQKPSVALTKKELITIIFSYFKTPKPQNLALVMFKGQAPWGDKTSITF